MSSDKYNIHDAVQYVIDESKKAYKLDADCPKEVVIPKRHRMQVDREIASHLNVNAEDVTDQTYEDLPRTLGYRITFD